MNYFEDHIGDYVAATAHLTWDEDMAYTRLIRAYYHTEKPIPRGQAYRLARAATPAQRKAVDTVLAEFFTEREDGFHQKRCDEEIARFQDKQAKARASAKARWSQSDGNADASPNAHADDMRTHMRTQSEGNATRARPQTPDTRHQTPIQNPNTSEASPPHPSATPDGSPDGLLPGMEPPTPKPSPKTVPDCPHAEVIALYAKHLPNLAQPRVWEGSRAEAMRARWRQCSQPSSFGKGYATAADGLAFWDRFFAYVASCPKLAKGILRPDGSAWEPDLQWLLNPTNFAKVIEGKYAP